MYDCLIWAALSYYHQNCIQSQIAMNGLTRSPADDFSGEKIQYDGKIEPARKLPPI